MEAKKEFLEKFLQKQQVSQTRPQITERHIAVAKYLKSNNGQSPLISDMIKTSPAKNIQGIFTELETNQNGDLYLRTADYKDKNSALRKIISPNSPENPEIFTEYDIYGDFEYWDEGKKHTLRNAERVIRHNNTGRMFATTDHYQGFEEITFR